MSLGFDVSVLGCIKETSPRTTVLSLELRCFEKTSRGPGCEHPRCPRGGPRWYSAAACILQNGAVIILKCY